MEVIAIKSFTAKCKIGEYPVKKYEKGTVISGFQFLKVKMDTGILIHCPEEYLGSKLIKLSDYIAGLDEFIEAEEMRI